MQADGIEFGGFFISGAEDPADKGALKRVKSALRPNLCPPFSVTDP
jgi:hypothetical protein